MNDTYERAYSALYIERDHHLEHSGAIGIPLLAG